MRLIDKFKIIALIVLISCGVPKASIKYVTYKQTQYEPERKRVTEFVTLNALIPQISPLTKQGEQRQVKGDVTITLELIPFVAKRHLDSMKYFAPVSHELFNRFDRIETRYIPGLMVSSSDEGKNDNVRFKITIKNNGERILKLQDVALAVVSDGKMITVPGENLIEWKSGMILRNYEKSFIIDGPSRYSLGTSKLLNITIYDVPTQYDMAGNTTRKDNFEWYYEIGQELSASFSDSVFSRYHYEPVHTETCKKCSGTGKLTIKEKCGACGGTGRIGTSTCYSCNGYGYKYKTYLCDQCSGKSILYFPKSNETEILNEVSETWSYSSFRLKIIGTANVTMWLYDRERNTYSIHSIYSNNYWFNPPDKEYPIMVRCKEKLLQVIPKDTDGSRIAVIVIDTRGSEPKVIKGRLSNEDFSGMIK